MSEVFRCKNGQKISWEFVCDGDESCLDGSDEEQCYCQGDVYACLQGNNVSCRLACATYGRVTCLTYQNRRACEQYNQELNTTPSMNDFDALQYSAGLAIGILLFLSILSILICMIGRKPSEFLHVCLDQSNRKSLHRLSSNPRYVPTPAIHYYPPISLNNPSESPAPARSSLHCSESIYYETIRTSSTSNSRSMLNSMAHEIPEIETHCV